MNTFNGFKAKELYEKFLKDGQKSLVSLNKQELEDKPEYFAGKLLDYALVLTEKSAALGYTTYTYTYFFNPENNLQKIYTTFVILCKLFTEKQFKITSKNINYCALTNCQFIQIEYTC